MIRPVRFLIGFMLVALDPASLVHAHEDSFQPAELHFAHPVISESPSPDSKVRGDYTLTKRTGDERALDHGVRFEGEYAPFRWMSFEVNLPYVVADRDERSNRQGLDDMEVAIKLASFALEDSGILLGGGMEFGLPTGNSNNDIGSDRVVMIEPYLDLGIKFADFETIGFLKFGFPENENGSDPDWELGWNASLLYHVTPSVAGMLEFDGERISGGEEDGETVAHVTPGLRVHPFEDHRLAFGTGISLPITNDEEFKLRWILSVFFHF